jgi:hypothetical protein
MPSGVSDEQFHSGLPSTVRIISKMAPARGAARVPMTAVMDGHRDAG